MQKSWCCSVMRHDALNPRPVACPSINLARWVFVVLDRCWKWRITVSCSRNMNMCSLSDVQCKRIIRETSNIYLIKVTNQEKGNERKDLRLGQRVWHAQFPPSERHYTRTMFTFSVPRLYLAFTFSAPSLSLHPPVTFSALASSLGWRITAWHITHFLHLFQENHGPVVPHSSDSSSLILSPSPSHWAHLANSQSSQTVWDIKLPASQLGFTLLP